MKIAFIGTGVMGSPMASHLSLVHQVTAFNRSQAKLDLLPPSIKRKSSLIETIKDQEIVMTMLGTPDDVNEVYQTLFHHVRAGTILVDFTTSSPTLAKQLYLQGLKQGIPVLDAPVTGGLKGAKEQSLTIMVGGQETVFTTIKPIFNLLAKQVMYVGEAGQGQAAKMANQIAIAGQLAGLAEALSFAKERQLNLEQILTILGSGAAQSYSVTAYGQKMIQQDWQATFYLKHFLKDLRIAIAHAATPLPITKKVEKLLAKLVKTYGEKGVQSIIQAYLK